MILIGSRLRDLRRRTDMRVFVTGEKGFIAQNLVPAFARLGHTVVSCDDPAMVRNNKGETCVHRNSESVWHNFFDNAKIDLVVHNAAVVGTDVVALNPSEATLSNVMGTYNVSRAARINKIPVCYLGTSVIYDTPKYQRRTISETSDQLPGTFYGAQKLAGEHIVMSSVPEWLIMRPLFAYGGLGDMNSLMAKTFYAHNRGLEKIDMFLNPKRRKDYMHVEDFCDAVALACDKELWCHDYNVSAEHPLETGEIVDVMSEVCGADLNRIIEWHPETDYLGNHILSSKKFRETTGWKPRYTLRSGLQQSWESICRASDAYNPLEYLEAAKTRGVDLLQHFPTIK
jgi:nucleoside-diphosphate-sugar epimerase